MVGRSGSDVSNFPILPPPPAEQHHFLRVPPASRAARRTGRRPDRARGVSARDAWGAGRHALRADGAVDRIAHTVPRVVDAPLGADAQASVVRAPHPLRLAIGARIRQLRLLLMSSHAARRALARGRRPGSRVPGGDRTCVATDKASQANPVLQEHCLLTRFALGAPASKALAMEILREGALQPAPGCTAKLDQASALRMPERE